MSKSSKQREFTFKYKFGGKYWETSVFADSIEEAKQKIRAQASAVYEGEIVARLPVLPRASWINRLMEWVKTK
nr:MAG TPA: HAMP N-terminal domain 3 [Caudoviricetes sp.]